MPGNTYLRLYNNALLPLVVLAFLLNLQPHAMNKQTLRQKALQFFYPAMMRLTSLFGANTTLLANKGMAQPSTSLYALPVVLNNGASKPLSDYKGRKLLLVNTASDCGYTGQYEALQQLWEQHQDKLIIIGFPANDFKEQEKGSDADIAQFCKLNYGVQFPLAKKSSVVKGAGQNAVFNWLSDAGKNGWNNHAPDWNFSKYLVNEAGVLTHYFGPSVSPLDPKVTQAIEQ